MIWIQRNLMSIAVAAVAMLIVVALLFLNQCSETRNTKGQGDLNARVGNSATASGVDAVDTVGNRMRAEQNDSEAVRETNDAIRNANSGAAVDDAALAGLRRVRKPTRP